MSARTISPVSYLHRGEVVRDFPPVLLPEVVGMSAQETLEKAARAAGAAGVTYEAWTYSDELQALIEPMNGDFDTDAVEAAYCEGRREHRSATWSSIWTTAPEAYDQHGTETAEGPFDWKGKKLRRVLICPPYFAFQTARYASGLCGEWEEDPRVTEAKRNETIARERAEAEERETRRIAGLEWIRAVDDAVLEDRNDELDAQLRARALRWEDVSAERKRRAAEKEASERAATWARCRAAFEDGATLIDKGTPTTRGYWGPIPGREPDAWRSVMVRPYYAKSDDALEASVFGEGGVRIGSLHLVAERIEKGEIRIAGPDDIVPPRAVVARIGGSFKEILRVEVDGGIAWVGRPLFAAEPLVLDDAARVVRKKKAREVALAAYYGTRLVP